MSYARLEALDGLQWPCYDEQHPGEVFLHSRLWERPVDGPRAPFIVVDARAAGRRARRRVPAAAHDRPPARGVQHRRADRRATRRRRGAARRSTSRPRTRRASGFARASRCACARAAARWWRRCTSTRRCGPGLTFMTFHFPDEVATNHADHRRDRSEVGHGGVQGGGRSASSAVEALAVTLMDISHRRRRSRPREERAAVDALLGPPGSGWEGGARDTARDGRTARGGRRGRRRAAAPAAAGVPRRAGPRRLGEPRRAQLHLPAPDRPAGRGLGRADVLSPVRDRAAAAGGGPRLRRHRLPRCAAPRRCARELERRMGPAGAARRRGAPGCAARASGSAIARRRCSSSGPARPPTRAVLAPVGDAAARAARRAPRRLVRRARSTDLRRLVPQAGRSGLALLRARRRRRSGEPRRLPRRRRLPGAGPGDRDRARRRSIAEVHRGEAARAAAARRFPTGSKWEAVAARAGAAALRGLQRRRVRARHLQGSRAAERRSVRHRRGDDDLRHRHRQRARLPLHPRRVSRCASVASPRAIGAGARRRAARRRRRRVGTSLRHRDAPRRRRLHLRRGDGALQLARGQARRAALEAAVSRRRSASSASRPWSTTSRRWPTCSTSCSRAARRGRRPAPPPPPARACSACRATSRGPGSTSCRSAARSREVIDARRRRGGRTAAAGGAARRRRRDVRRAASRSTCRSPSRTSRAAGATLGSGVVMVFDDTRRSARHARPHRRVLRATRSAASACRAGSAPCASASCSSSCGPAGRTRPATRRGCSC